MAIIEHAQLQNRLLVSLRSQEFAKLVPCLEPVQLPIEYVLAAPNEPIKHVHFIESGMVSVVAEKRDRRSVEVGIYGREGLGVTSVVLGSDQTPHHHYMQIAGSGFRMPTAQFLRLVDEIPALRSLILRFIHVFMTQTAQTALVNASANIEERLARWILMCKDRLDSDEFTITHDFLAMMLGVRRSSVTDALHMLESGALIKSTRGIIKILDRARLEHTAGASYGLPEAEYRRLIGQL